MKKTEEKQMRFRGKRIEDELTRFHNEKQEYKISTKG
jgi:hypothetical protein